jgi:Rrf2 family nitric oxide-sensitive transcriptional repressor
MLLPASTKSNIVHASFGGAMRLTLYTDFSLRLLMYLAAKPSGVATIQEIANRYGISRNHLMKVARQLGGAGFIETMRGRGGGLRLGRAAKNIRLGDVVRTTEEDFRMVECFEPGRSTCVLLPKCRLKGALADALAAFFAVLDSHTLADLTTPSRDVRRALQLGDREAA